VGQVPVEDYMSMDSSVQAKARKALDFFDSVFLTSPVRRLFLLPSAPFAYRDVGEALKAIWLAPSDSKPTNATEYDLCARLFFAYSTRAFLNHGTRIRCLRVACELSAYGCFEINSKERSNALGISLDITNLVANSIFEDLGTGGHVRNTATARRFALAELKKRVWGVTKSVPEQHHLLQRLENACKIMGLSSDEVHMLAARNPQLRTT
jgi:hypothetical protein